MAMRKVTEEMKVKSAKKVCGIIMPITGCTYKDTEYSATHWASMRKFLEDAISDAGFEPRVVWDDKSQSIIQGRIVNNIAEFDLAICVICGMNHNVLIELGLRLMTNKPVLVIHDDNNMPLPFDVNSLESFGMPVPNRVDYVDYQDLKGQIKNALEKMADPNYKTFLSYFKQVAPKAVSKIDEVELAQFMNETRNALQEVQSQISAARASEICAFDYAQKDDIVQSMVRLQLTVAADGLKDELDRIRNSSESTRGDYLGLIARARDILARVEKQGEGSSPRSFELRRNVQGVIRRATLMMAEKFG